MTDDTGHSLRKVRADKDREWVPQTVEAVVLGGTREKVSKETRGVGGASNLRGMG